MSDMNDVLVEMDKEGFVDRFRITTEDPDVFAEGTVGPCGDIHFFVGLVMSVPGDKFSITGLTPRAVLR